MGKYTTGKMVPPPQRPWQVHPIWRAIGCLMVIIGLPLAYAASELLYSMNLQRGWLAVPYEFSQDFTVPLVYFTIPHAVATAVMMVLLLIIGFTVIMVIYSMMYGIMGPSRYGPLDSPPIRQKRR